MLCIGYSHLIIIIIAVFIGLFYLYTKYKSTDDENSYLKKNMDEKINVLSKKINENKQIQQEQNNRNDLYENIRTK